MPAWSRIPPSDFRARPLRMHGLLADVPLHDVWRVELPGGPRELDLRRVRALMDVEELMAANTAVRALFALRGAMGRVFRWDGADAAPGRERAVSEESYLHRLTDEDRAASLDPPGTADGPFMILYSFANEAVSEIRNKTVHAFSGMSLEPSDAGYTLYWAIYVMPVGAGHLTRGYMALIDPFRRWVVYPAMFRRLCQLWAERFQT